jgi:ribosome-associated protein
MIQVTNSIALHEDELQESFIRASGPGGQNVNKVESAVQLRFDVRHSPSLPDHVKERLERLAGRRLTNDGVLIITAQRFRTQERNREDALERLVALIRQATERPEAPAPDPADARLQAPQAGGQGTPLGDQEGAQRQAGRRLDVAPVGPRAPP